MDWGWSEFEANKKGFPKGLKHTATKIRDEHPNIQHIAVWHALVISLPIVRQLALTPYPRWATGLPYLPKGRLPKNTKHGLFPEVAVCQAMANGALFTKMMWIVCTMISTSKSCPFSVCTNESLERAASHRNTGSYFPVVWTL